MIDPQCHAGPSRGSRYRVCSMTPINSSTDANSGSTGGMPPTAVHGGWPVAIVYGLEPVLLFTATLIRVCTDSHCKSHVHPRVPLPVNACPTNLLRRSTIPLDSTWHGVRGASSMLWSLRNGGTTPSTKQKALSVCRTAGGTTGRSKMRDLSAAATVAPSARSHATSSS